MILPSIQWVEKFIGVVLIALFFYLGTQFLYHPPVTNVAQAAEVTATTSRSAMKEIHIANNGNILLRGAQVTQVSGDDISLGTEWDSIKLSWAAHTTPGKSMATKFWTKSGKKGTIADIHVGDILTLSGRLITGQGSPTIDADFVRQQ